MKRFIIDEMLPCETTYIETVYVGTGREVLSFFKNLMKHTNRISCKYENNNGLPFVDTRGIQGIELCLAQEYSIYWTPRFRVMSKNETSKFLLEML